MQLLNSFQFNNLLSLIIERFGSLLTKLHIVNFSHLTVFNTRHASITAGLTYIFCNTAQGMGLRYWYRTNNHIV